MIFLTVILFVFSDAAFNHWRERQGHVINHWWNTLYRIIFGALLYWGYGIYGLIWQQQVYFCVACFFIFWLLFNPTLNWFNELPWDYLGTRAILDKLERKAPLFVLWIKVLCAPSFIYFYFNPNPFY